MLQVELERLDALTLAYMAGALSGNEKHAHLALKIMERRAKLLGLDAPSKQEITGAGGAPVVDLGEVSSERLKQIVAELESCK